MEVDASLPPQKMRCCTGCPSLELEQNRPRSSMVLRSALRERKGMASITRSPHEKNTFLSIDDVADCAAAIRGR